jgi:hypothetical protein
MAIRLLNKGDQGGNRRHSPQLALYALEWRRYPGGQEKTSGMF